MADKVWVDDYLIRCYQYAQLGMGDMKIAKELGVTYKTFKAWLGKKAPLRNALKEARKRIKQEANFRDYVYNRLNGELQGVWDSINDPEMTLEEIESILMNKGDKVRQRLFLHAFCTNSFDPNEACSAVNISKKQLKKWIATEPDFADLMLEIESIKNDFGESCLFKLMQEGNAAAILFYNERKNDARGYGKKMKVQHEGAVTHSHVVSMEDLHLDLSTEKQLLKAIRDRQTAALDYDGPVIEAEYEVK